MRVADEYQRHCRHPGSRVNQARSQRLGNGSPPSRGGPAAVPPGRHVARRARLDRPGLLAGPVLAAMAVGAEGVEHGVDAARLGGAPGLVAGVAALGPRPRSAKLWWQVTQPTSCGTCGRSASASSGRVAIAGRRAATPQSAPAPADGEPGHDQPRLIAQPRRPATTPGTPRRSHQQAARATSTLAPAEPAAASARPGLASTAAPAERSTVAAKVTGGRQRLPRARRQVW